MHAAALMNYHRSKSKCRVASNSDYKKKKRHPFYSKCSVAVEFPRRQLTYTIWDTVTLKMWKNKKKQKNNPPSAGLAARIFSSEPPSYDGEFNSRNIFTSLLDLACLLRMMYFGPTPTTLPSPGGSVAGTSRALSTARFYSLNGKHEKLPFMQPRLSTPPTPTPPKPSPPFCLKQVIQSMLPLSTHKSNMASPYYLLYMFLSPSLFSWNTYIFISPPLI